MKVTVALDHGVQIPGDVEARVIRASPVGEQRIDFMPMHGGTAPPLKNGAVVPARPDAEPPVVSDVVDITVRLLEAIPADQLNTLIHETAVALRGRSDDIRTIIDASDVFSQEFLAHEQGFRQLLTSAPPVLDSVAAVGPQLRQALANTTVLTAVLAQRRNDLVALMREGARLGTAGNDLVGTQKANLACLVSDVADLTRFFAKPGPLSNLDTGLRTNQQFFGPIDKIAPSGPATDIGLGAPARDDQVWLRVRTLIPPGQPSAISYNPKRPTPPTKPGAACTNVFGTGVGPATQANPEAPAKGGSVQPAGPGDSQVTPGPDSPSLLPAAARHPLGRTPGAGADAAPRGCGPGRAGPAVGAVAASPRRGARGVTEVTSPELEGEEAGRSQRGPAWSASPGGVGRRRFGSRLRLRSRRELVLALVAALGLIGTLVFGLAWGQARSHNDGANQARAAGRNFLIALTNFDGKTIDADVRRIAGYASGAFAQQLTQFFAADVRAALKENQASSRGEIKDLFVQSYSGGQVRVYAVVDQTIANLQIPTPQADELRIELGLTRVKGAWRVYDVRVLQGPAAGLSGSQPARGQRRPSLRQARRRPARNGQDRWSGVCMLRPPTAF